MSFSEIKGQEQAITGLTNSLAQGRIAHAYLFFGPKGVGKKKTALAFAEALKALEVKCISPQGGRIKIEQIREMQREVYLRPYVGEKKLYLIEDAEKMGEEAANSLLKILEEPPFYAIIILLTPYPYSLLATIRSRCQPVAFQALNEKLVGEILACHFSLEEWERPIIARLAEGSLEKAFLLAQGNLSEKRNNLWRFIEELSLGKRENFIKEAEEWDKEGREGIQDKLDLLTTCYRDLLIWQKTQNRDYLVNLDHLEAIKAAASLLSFPGLTARMNSIQETKRMIKQNVNSRLALEVLFLKLSKRAEEEKCIQ